jgi:hypothetical protein
MIGRGRVKLLLKDERMKSIPRVLHIPNLPRTLISISKMSDVGVHSVFEKENCKMV